jgi:hypothetical protein
MIPSEKYCGEELEPVSYVPTMRRRSSQEIVCVCVCVCDRERGRERGRERERDTIRHTERDPTDLRREMN